VTSTTSISVYFRRSDGQERRVAVQHGEIGLVTADERLVGFYRDVFQLPELEPRRLPTGVVHRLGPDPAILKIMVPAEKPAAAVPPPDEFWQSAGLRYFTLWVDDLDDAARRSSEHGGVITFGPIELRPGVTTMILRDPDGNLAEIMQDASA
jgi:predicted enzyme related to lactoylglutathione lyase